MKSGDKINCLLVDDEPIALKIIRGFLENFSEVEIIAECRNAIQAFEILQKTPIDLLFLDINMPKMTGIDFLKSLSHPPQVIITTAYREYALEGFDLEVLDYLLKPISLERFLQAMDRFFRMRNLSQPASEKSDSQREEGEFIFLKEGRLTHKIPLNQILFCESMKEYVTVHLEDRDLRMKSRLSNIEAKLPESQFMRIHKSFLISLAKMSSFDAKSVYIGQTLLPVSRSYRVEFMKRVYETKDPA